MDKIFEQLGALFLSSLPSLFLLILLFFYLKAVLFDPLEKILAERYQKSEGKEKRASDTIRQAELKAEEYAQAIQAAKSEIYAKQEALRQSLEKERNEAVAKASRDAKSHVEQAHAVIEADLDKAISGVEHEASALATMIANKVLFREAA